MKEKTICSQNIDSVGLPLRVVNLMRAHHIYSVGGMLEYGRNKLLTIPGFGKASLAAVDRFVSINSLEWKDKVISENKKKKTSRIQDQHDISCYTLIRNKYVKSLIKLFGFLIVTILTYLITDKLDTISKLVATQREEKVYDLFASGLWNYSNNDNKKAHAKLDKIITRKWSDNFFKTQASLWSIIISGSNLNDIDYNEIDKYTDSFFKFSDEFDVTPSFLLRFLPLISQNKICDAISLYKGINNDIRYRKQLDLLTLYQETPDSVFHEVIENKYSFCAEKYSRGLETLCWKLLSSKINIPEVNLSFLFTQFKNALFEIEDGLFCDYDPLFNIY